jgi:hypothetical protein
MFLVDLGRCQDPDYSPLTIRASEYLFHLAQFIARSIPNSEVRAQLGPLGADSVIFRGEAVAADEAELF